MANSDFTFKLDETGYRTLRHKLSSLEKADKSSTIQGGLMRGISVIYSAGKANLTQKKTGNLKRSMKKSVQKKKLSAYAGFKRSTPEKKIQGGNHAHLVDRGTAKRWTKKGYYRGSVSKNAPYTGSLFWTKAVLNNGDKALSILMDAIDKEITRILGRN